MHAYSYTETLYELRKHDTKFNAYIIFRSGSYDTGGALRKRVASAVPSGGLSRIGISHAFLRFWNLALAEKLCKSYTFEFYQSYLESGIFSGIFVKKLWDSESRTLRRLYTRVYTRETSVVHRTLLTLRLHLLQTAVLPTLRYTIYGPAKAFVKFTDYDRLSVDLLYHVRVRPMVPLPCGCIQKMEGATGIAL